MLLKLYHISEFLGYLVKLQIMIEEVCVGPGIAYFLLAPKCYCCWSEKQDSQRSLQKQKCRLIAICKYLLSTYSVQGHARIDLSIMPVLWCFTDTDNPALSHPGHLTSSTERKFNSRGQCFLFVCFLFLNKRGWKCFCVFLTLLHRLNITLWPDLPEQPPEVIAKCL